MVGYTPPPEVEATAEVGTHPTGMLSCEVDVYSLVAYKAFPRRCTYRSLKNN